MIFVDDCIENHDRSERITNREHWSPEVQSTHKPAIAYIGWQTLAIDDQSCLVVRQDLILVRFINLFDLEQVRGHVR